jgi:hypothetical protein
MSDACVGLQMLYNPFLEGSTNTLKITAPEHDNAGEDSGFVFGKCPVNPHRHTD